MSKIILITFALLGFSWVAYSSTLDEKREKAYENCTYTEDYQVVCK